MMTCSDGGGGGNGAAGGDGLVNPAGLIAKSADLDTTLITGAADGIRSMGSTVDTQTDAIKTEWSTKLPGCYQAPEQESVFALMSDPATASETLKTTFDKMAGFLDTYAAELDKIKPTLSDWETRAQDFHDRVVDGVWVNKNEAKDSNLGDDVVALWNSAWGNEQEQVKVSWKEDTGTVEENQGYIDEIAVIYEQVSTAAATCATSINGLTSLPPDKQTIPPIPKEAFTNPEAPMPWGYKAQEDRNCRESTGHGVSEFATGTVNGLGSLISYNPETGEWGDWANAGQAWMGTGNLLLSLAVTSSPLAWAVNGALKATGNGDSAVSQWIDERNTMTATVATSLVGIDLTADDIFHKWKEDGVATFTESFLNVGTMFIPGAGPVAGGLKAASIGARVARITSAVADFAVPGGSFLVKGGIHTIPVLKNVFKFADEVPVNMLDDAVEGGARIPRFNPTAAIDDVVPDLSATPVEKTATHYTFGDAPEVDAPRSSTATTEATYTRPVNQPVVEPASVTHGETGTGRTGHPTGANPLTEPATSAARPESASHPVEVTEPATRTEPAVDTRPQPVADPEPATEPATRTEPAVDTHPQPVADPEPVTEPATRTEPVVDTHPQAATDPAGTTHGDAGSQSGPPSESTFHESGAGHGPGESVAADVNAHAGQPGVHAHGDAPAADVDTHGHTDRPGTEAGRPSDPHPQEAPDGGPTTDRHGRDYAFDTDGRRHLDHDDPGTYRDENGALHHEEGGRFAPDNNRPDAQPTQKADLGDSHDATLIDPDVAAHHQDLLGKRADAEVLSHQANAEYHQLVVDAGIDPKTLTGDRATVAQTLKELQRSGKIDAQTAQQLAQANVKRSVLAQAFRKASAALGDHPTQYLVAQRGDTTLFGDAGVGASRFDHGSVGVDQRVIDGRTTDVPHFTIGENKGGNSGLGYRTIDGVKVQQGTAAYANDVTRVDKRVAQSLNDYLADPAGDPRIKQAIKDGTIEVRYEMIQSLPSGRIKVTQFVLDAKIKIPGVGG